MQRNAFNKNQIIQTVAVCIAALALAFGAVQTCTIRADYEARTRPHLVIKDINPEVERGDENWFPLSVTIENFGELPATNVRIERIVMGGDNIAWVSEGLYVIPPQYRDSRSDLLFIPGRPNKTTFLVDRKTWETTITVGASMEIEIDYFGRGTDYWYSVEMLLQSEDNWVVRSERIGRKGGTDMEYLVPAVIAFAATFVGVFLAYYLAARQERRKRETEQSEARKTVKTALARELTAIKTNLDGAVGLRTEGKIGDIPNVDLLTDAKQSAVNSGTFSLLESELRSEVSHVYAVVQRAETFLSQMREFVVSPSLALTARDEIFKSIAMNFWGQVHHLQQQIPTVVKKLQEPK